MKRRFRFISIILVLALLLPSAPVISATAEEYICPICHKSCGGWEEETVSPATCTSPRQVSYHCERFGYEETFEVGTPDPYNHTELNYVETVEPTCTESGYDLYMCSDCGESITFEILPLHPAGHNFVAESFNCTSATASYRCTICGDTKQEPKAPTEHIYKAEPFSCYDECIDYHCTVCGALMQEEKAPSEHKWSDWSMIKEPTATADGQRTRICTACSESETETVPAGSVSKFIKDVSLGDTTMQYKSSAVIEAEVLSASGAKIKVEYSSSAPDVVSVDNSGNITAHKTGSAVITVTAADADGFTVKDTAVITVKYAWWQWIINILLLGFLWY